jgi:2-octaprenyl-6-methoxyphenol hydroxylase
VLVGDAARGIHPIAGQGWNLALRDVAAVAEIVADRLRLGLDPGDAMALERYAAWRRFDGLALVGITDGINRLFANDLFPLKVAREAGLALVDRLPPVKRFFMRHAMGLVGDLPRAMRGLPI